MATKQVNGSATTATSTNNNTGRIRNGGTIGGTLFESAPLTTDIDTAISSGVYNTMRAGQYVIRKVTTMLAGLTNTTLRSGGSDYGTRRSIKFIERMRTTFLTTMSWTSDKDGMPTYTFTRTTTNTSFGTDDAARPTLLVPGEITYRNGSANPVNDELQARNQN
jgi:hypothetical protein